MEALGRTSQTAANGAPFDLGGEPRNSVTEQWNRVYFHDGKSSNSMDQSHNTTTGRTLERENHFH